MSHKFSIFCKALLKIVITTSIITNVAEVTTESQCSGNKYGPVCQYECHCKSGQACNRVQGCAGFCDKDNGWDGPTCQRKNVVLRRPNVHQGPGVFRSEAMIDYSADLVVDGNIGHNFYKTPCALTVDSTTVKSWWNVTLDEEYYIYRFALYNRQDGSLRRNNGFILSVGRSSVPGFDYKDCYRDTETGNPDLIRKGTCINNTPLKGDVIQIRQTTFRPLQICELIVHVCLNGWYGEECNRMCLTATNCARCDVGQISCDECVSGKWGEHCLDNTCNCLEGMSCNKTNGRCPKDKCAAGFKGNTCNQPCTPGTYGPDCSSTCGSCYLKNRPCNITNGYCPEGDHRCEKGYQGLTCHEECPNDKWDYECSQSCGNCRGDNGCDKMNGICPKITENLRCKPGYLESDNSCKQACDAGKWGDNCDSNCSENCFGSPCTNENGACPGGCLQGYTGATCENKCSLGFWGYNCNETCSMNCLNGYASCSQLNGTCVKGCVQGFEGERCQLTAVGNKSPEIPSFPAVYIGVAVLAVLCLLVSAIAVMFYVKLRRLTRLHEEDVRARYTNIQMKPGGEVKQAPDPVYEEMKN